MSNFFSSIGGRRGGGDTSNYDNPGGDGEDDDQHYQVPPREISFRYDTADYGHGSSTRPCQQQQQQLDLYNYSPSSRRSTSSMHDAERMMMTTMSRGSGGGICCLDCGNQAKKDCSHQRCRTCCKSRGFDCLTHVKSTWVPATRRRERQQHQQHQLHLSSSQLHTRQQLEDPTGAGTSLTHDQSGSPPDDLYEYSMSVPPSGLEFVRYYYGNQSPAMFRCVRVSSSDEVEDHDQYAYQTAVNIGGHVFKGILYDQGPDRIPGDAAAGESSSGGGSGGVTQPLSLGGGTAESGGGASAPLFDPYTSMYPPPFNSYNMSGTQFFPPPRSLDPALTMAVSFS